MKTIYLDNAATTPLRTEVLEAMLPHLKETYGNPSSMHHRGRRAFDVVRNARAAIAQALGVSPAEIIFTSSGTEGNNLAIFGTAHVYDKHKKHLLISAVEHASVLGASEQLRDEGFDVEYIPVDTYGQINVTDVLSRVRDDTFLVSIMCANNEIGTVQPIRELSHALRTIPMQNNRPLLHTDACQAIGQLPITPNTLGVDLMTVNGSKIYGPKGTGMLFVRTGTKLTPHLVGGAQEFGKRAGTENVAGIVGFAEALQLAVSEQETQSAKLQRLRDTFTVALRRAIPDIMLNGHPTERLPNNVHISLPYIEGESLILMLDTYGICASTGSACGAHNLVPSHVLRAIGQSSELIHGSVRFTLGRETTQDDLEHTVTALRACALRLRALSALPLHV